MRAFRRAWKQRAVSRYMVAIAVISTSCIGKGRPTVSKRKRLVWTGWGLAILWKLISHEITSVPRMLAERTGKWAKNVRAYREEFDNDLGTYHVKSLLLLAALTDPTLRRIVRNINTDVCGARFVDYYGTCPAIALEIGPIP